MHNHESHAKRPSAPRLKPLALAIFATLAPPLSADQPQLAPESPASAGVRAGIESASHQPRNVLYVLDGELATAEGLRDALPPGATLLELSPRESGIARISEALRANPGIQELHLISHGGTGYLRLGGDILSPDTLDHHAGALSQWRATLHTEAELLLYGCEVAASEEGRMLVRRIADLTGADIAASDDNTGNAAAGGDWELEYAAGEVAAVPLSAPNYSGILADITVTSLSDDITDDDQCTLREAIVAANTDAAYNGCPAGNGADTIRFSSGGVLALDSSLPTVTAPLHIDGDAAGDGAIGVTLDGLDQSPILAVNDSDLTLSRLHLTRAHGSALNSLESGLTISDALFTYNSGKYGGAIYSSYSDTRISGSRFANNTSRGGILPSSGGAIYADFGTLDIQQSEFVGNRAIGGDDDGSAAGGAIYCAETTTTLQDIRFYENHAVSQYGAAYGGGLYQLDGSLSISGDSVFSGNISRGADTAIGGAIYLKGVSARIEGAEFAYNRAYGAVARGGAIGNYYYNYNYNYYYAEERARRASQTVPGTLAKTANTLLDGMLDDLENVHQARAAATTPALSMVGTHFYQNGLQAPGDTAYGGAVFNHGGALIMTGSTLEQNRILDETGALRGYGGAIFNGYGGFVQVIESTLTENRAKTGGGLFNQQALASVSSTSVTNNQAYIGGGMVNSGLDLRAYTQEGSGPLERKTDGDKRQLSSGVNAVDMANSSVSGNSALIGGGIANLLSGVTRIEGSTLNHNYAVRGGGGLLAFRGMSFITNGTLSGNATAAEGAGSAILATDINLLQLETPQRSELRERNPDGATSTDQTSAERLSRMLEEAASEREPIPAITLTGLIHTTVSNHTGPVPTLAFAGGQAAFNNTLIGDNSGDNCVAAFYTAFQANHTLVDDASCTLYSPGFSETNAIGIGPLQDNGGTTLTHALTAASPALDAGDPATPESVPLTTDQRGEGFARVVNDLPDIGAFEARAPHLEVGGLTAEGLDFGALPVGETSSPLDLTLSNTGELALEPGEISVEGDYAISENGCEGRSLAQNESCTLRITFTPSAEGSRPGTLTVPSNAADSPLEANLSGEGLIRALTLDDVAFGGQELGSVSEQNLRISNTGSTSLTIDGITITNTSNGAFTIFDDPCSGKTLAVDEGCSLGIRFNPSTTGPLSDTLEVASNASDSPHTANLSGNGIEADEPPPVEPTPQQPAEPIPALGPLGLWLASLGAGLLGLLGMRRRKP